MPSAFDAVVVGLGAMGSAACFHLAKAGKRVLGVDRFSPPHTLGSTHGRTRIIREAYFEHPLYVPLVQRAYELWFELEKQSQRHLFLQTGGLMISNPNCIVFDGARRSAEEHHLAHEILDAAEVRRRFPALRPDDDMAAVWEPRAGILFPEQCIEVHLKLAKELGATVITEQPVIDWKPLGSGVRIRTPQGHYDAERMILSAGAWNASLLAELGLPLQVERQVLYWFDQTIPSGDFGPDRCPIHLWGYRGGDHFFYGFPDLGDGVKVARHHDGETVLPDTVTREVSDLETEEMRTLLRQFIPKAAGSLKSATVCLYTNTPDKHFLIDTHPEYKQVLIASPCSGHGFKFSSAVGEVLSDWVQDKPPRFDLRLFQRSRFLKKV